MGEYTDEILGHVEFIHEELNSITTICLKLEARIDVMTAQLEVLRGYLRDQKHRETFND